MYTTQLSSDNNAFEFLLSYGKELFPGTPLVSCGLNNFDDSLIAGKGPGYTVITEEIDIAGTIDLALSQFPASEIVAVVSDDTSTDRENRQLLERIKPTYEGRVEFIDLAGLPAAELKRELQRLPADSIILLFNYYRDLEGNHYQLNEGIDLIEEASPFPVYSMWRDKIEAGALGGVICDGTLQGKEMIHIGVQLLEGTAAEDIPTTNSGPQQFIFNFAKLQHYGIRPFTLPENSLIIGEPESFIYTYRTYASIAATFALILIIIIALLLFSRQRRKETLTALKQSLNENELLMQELNHRVKNNLLLVSSLISLKEATFEGRCDLSDIRHQVDVIRILHEKLHQATAITHIDMRSYIEELLSVVFSFSEIKVICRLDISGIEIETKSAISVALIINEIATNAMKHGFLPEEEAHFSISMHYRRQAEEYELVIESSGRPLPDDVDFENPSSLGLRIIGSLVTQLKGKIEVTKEGRPKFLLTFPNTSAGTVQGSSGNS
jgi:two-component sensor histidine kinase